MPFSVSSRSRPSRRRTLSSAITARTGSPPSLWCRRRRAPDPQQTVESLDAVGESTQPVPSSVSAPPTRRRPPGSTTWPSRGRRLPKPWSQRVLPMSRGSRRRRRRRRPRAARAARARSTRSRTGTGARAASWSSATRARARSGPPDGYLGRSRAALPAMSRSPGAPGRASTVAAGRDLGLQQAQVQRESHQPLLRTVVQVALQPSRSCGRCDDSCAGSDLGHAGAQLGVQASVVDRETRGRRHSRRVRFVIEGGVVDQRGDAGPVVV